MKKLIYIGFEFQHHKGTNAGYHHIKEYVKYDKVINAQWELELFNRNTIFNKIINKINYILLGRGHSFTMIRCIILALFNKNQIFHFIYAENTYKWLHFFKGKTNEIVCTFHQPASYFLENKYWLKVIPKVDKIILMSKNDIEWFEGLTHKNNVYFIPHGVNTNFYKPDYTLEKNIDILFVGNWLRDFEFANNLFTKLLNINKDLKICIVTNKCNFSYFEDLKTVKLLTGITDTELRNLYQSAKCIFLPLKMYTANNAVLEAAATGCKIIISTKNFDNSYLNDGYVDFLDLDIEQVLDYFTIKISNGFQFNKLIETHSYIELNYSWNKVGCQTLKILESYV